VDTTCLLIKSGRAFVLYVRIVCFVSFSLLFVCICVLYCYRVATQLQLNISYHITYTIYIYMYHISYHISYLVRCGMGSVVGRPIATGCGLDGQGIESQWGAKIFAPVQTGPGAHIASCTMGTGSFPG
jgi:hypothetical protein